jgi:hypothetical protein
VAVADGFSATEPDAAPTARRSRPLQAKRKGRNRVVIDGGIAPPAEPLTAVR